MSTEPTPVPVTTPAVLTVAILPLAVVQVPPVVVSDNVVVDPTHKVMVPVIDAGTGFTVTTVVVVHPAGEL